MINKISIASDRNGIELKTHIYNYLKNQICAQLVTSDNYYQDYEENNYEIFDLGCYSGEAGDYPDYAELLCNHILEEESELGVLICKTGIGMSIAANRFSKIRAALCHNLDMAKKARMYYDANIMIIGSELVNKDEINQMIQAFITTKFEGGRHASRINKIS